jgi:plasmid stabilization system protein ParE
MMGGRIEIHSRVEDSDLVEIARYLSRDNPAAAARVFDAIEHTLVRLAAFPDMGTRYHAARKTLANLRMMPVTRFRNYLIFYLPLPGGEGIRVLHVINAARDQPAVVLRERRN